jgi:hypothetical protein
MRYLFLKNRLLPWFFIPVLLVALAGGLGGKGYTQSEGPEAIRLESPEVVHGAAFGRSVSMDGDYLAVGASGIEAVFIYQKNGSEWVESARIEPQQPHPGSAFGWSVSLSGDTLAVGAVYAPAAVGGRGAGAAYIFKHQGSAWIEQARLEAVDGSPYALFGRSLALDRDTLIVGARGTYESWAGRNTGAAYIFHRDGDRWIEQARLTSPDLNADSFFGSSVSIQGDHAAVGAPGKSSPSGVRNSGKIYLFERFEGAWYSHSQIESPSPHDFSQFGSSVMLGGSGDQPEWMVAGAAFDGYQSGMDIRFTSVPGGLYLYQREADAWTLTTRIEPEMVSLHNQEYYLPQEQVAASQDAQGRVLIAVGSSWMPMVNLYLQEGDRFEQISLPKSEDFVSVAYGPTVALDGEVLITGAHADGVVINHTVTHAGSVHVIDLEEGLR